MELQMLILNADFGASSSILTTIANGELFILLSFMVHVRVLWLFRFWSKNKSSKIFLRSASLLRSRIKIGTWRDFYAGA